MNNQAISEESSLKFGLEAIKRRSNFALENLHRFHNGLVIPAWKSYKDGRIYIQVDVVSSVVASSGWSRMTLKASQCADSEAMRSGLGTPNRGEFPMLVGVRDISKCFCPLDSFVRLQVFQHGDMRWADSTEPLFRSGVEASSCIFGIGLDVFDDELRSIMDDARVLKGQLINKVVKRGPEMMDDGANRNRCGKGDDGEINALNSTEIDTVNALSTCQIIIGERVLIFFPSEPFQERFKFVKVSIGPVCMN